MSRLVYMNGEFVPESDAKINNNLIGNGEKGSVFLKLISEWSKNVDVDIPKQIRDFNKEIKELKGSTPYKFSKMKEDN